MAAPPPIPTPASQPDGLGLAYTRLWLASSVSFVGDGVFYTALPLLAAALTRDPLGVAAVEAAGQLPWLLFALPAGALVDRWDRRRVLWLTDAYRSLVLVALTGAVMVGWASIPLLGAAGFLLGLGSVLFTPAVMSILPAIVTREPARLERANGRLAAAQTVGEHFLGPPAGGALFTVSRSLPLAVDALSFAVSAALIASIPGRYRAAATAGAEDAAPPAPGAASRASLRTEIIEGLRWLAGHRLLRALAAMVAISSLALSAWTSIMVLFAQDLLGLGNVGYGLLWTGVAAGSLLGSLLAAHLARWLGGGPLLIVTAAAFGATTIGIGASSSPWVAGALLGALGAAVTTWNVVVVSLRQSIVPDLLVGRVNSAFQLLGMGMLPLGAALGGVLGRTLGLRAPFLISGAAMLVTALVAIPTVTTRAIEAARAEA
jgi:MFS family permease